MQEHPMQPSGFLLDQWELQAKDLVGSTNHHDKQAIRQGSFGVVHRKALCLAYAAGADHELEACCELISQIWDMEHCTTLDDVLRELRRCRRPKPLSLKEQALIILDDIDSQLDAAHYNILRRAIEALPD
jgi:hypothetical protein